MGTFIKNVEKIRKIIKKGGAAPDRDAIILSQLSARGGVLSAPMPRPMFDAFSYREACARLVTDACVALATEGSLTKEDADRIIDAAEGGDATLLASASSMAETHPAWFVERACKRLKLREFSEEQLLALPAPTDAIAPATQQQQLPPPPDLTTVVQTHHNDSTTFTTLKKNGVELERRIYMLPPETQTAPPQVDLTDEPVANTENDLLVSGKSREREDLERQKRKEELICGVCKFRAKSAAGLTAHTRRCVLKKPFPNSGHINDDDEEQVDMAASTLTAIQGSQSNAHEDGFDDDLMGDHEDRRRLADMSELERERILTERSDARKAMETRRKVMEMAERARSKHVVDDRIALTKIVEYVKKHKSGKKLGKRLPIGISRVVAAAHTLARGRPRGEDVQQWWVERGFRRYDVNDFVESDESDDEYQQIQQEPVPVSQDNAKINALKKERAAAQRQLKSHQRLVEMTSSGGRRPELSYVTDDEGDDAMNERAHGLACLDFFKKLGRDIEGSVVLSDDARRYECDTSWSCVMDCEEALPPNIRAYKYTGHDTKGFVFVVKGGKRPEGNRKLTWMYFPRRFSEILNEINEYVATVGAENAAIIQTLLQVYAEHGVLACTKRGLNIPGVCSKPCERCWPRIQKWEQELGNGKWVKPSKKKANGDWPLEHLKQLTTEVGGEYDDSDIDEPRLEDAMSKFMKEPEHSFYTMEQCMAEYERIVGEHKSYKILETVLVELVHSDHDDTSVGAETRPIHWPAKIFSLSHRRECYNILLPFGVGPEGYFVIDPDGDKYAAYDKELSERLVVVSSTRLCKVDESDLSKYIDANLSALSSRTAKIQMKKAFLELQKNE